MIEFDVVTIFPDSIRTFFKEGIFRIAQEKELVKLRVFDLRHWTDDKHRSIDDRPYGGGPGMIMKIEPIDRAIKDLRKTNSKVLLTTPRGTKLNQSVLKKFVKKDTPHYIILAGHYEGIDERVYDLLIDYEISIGDYILSGGELPSLVFIDGYLRLIDGVLGNDESNLNESFEKDLLEYPQYTRPEEYDDLKVPKVLLNGNHKEIDEWRKKESLKLTKTKRPDLLK